MSMKDFNCDMLELSFWVTSEEVEQDTFLKAFGIENKDEHVDEDGDIYLTRMFGRREKTSDYHAHIVVRLDNEGKGKIDLRYHASGVDIEDERPPHAEDCAQWLGGLFKSEEVKTHIAAGFTFNKSFTPTIALPFPLATSEKALAGSSVTGVAIQFPEQAPLDLAIIQLGKEETYINAFAAPKVRLKDFDLLAELTKLSTSVNPLVRKQERGEEAVNVQSEE